MTKLRRLLLTTIVLLFGVLAFTFTTSIPSTAHAADGKKKSKKKKEKDKEKGAKAVKKKDGAGADSESGDEGTDKKDAEEAAKSW